MSATEEVTLGAEQLIEETKAKLQITTGWAVVKEVPSGDSLVLCPKVANDVIPPTKNVIISGIIAPRIGRGKRGSDEPFAWASREYLRKRLIGKQVQFKINYAAEGATREYATIIANGVDIASELVKMGWVRVKPDKREGRSSSERENLLILEKNAQDMGLGMWSKNVDSSKQVRTTDWNADARQLVNKFRGVPLPAVIDRVQDGSTYRVEILGPELRHTVVNVSLAGVLCPPTPIPYNFLLQQYEKRIAENPELELEPPVEETPEPFAEEARFFVEFKLLNRDVKIIPLAADKLNNLYATVEYKKGNIGAKLLEEGYGKYVQWSGRLTSYDEKLRASYALGGQAQKRVLAEGAQAIVDPVAFDAKVVSVNSGDSINIDDGTGEKRVVFASLRAPRFGGRRNRHDDDDPLSYEAREQLRKGLVGKQVRVVPEYTREAPAASKNKTPRQFVTVYLGKENVNLTQVKLGFATIIKHRKDEARASNYDELIREEYAAEVDQRGVFGNNLPSARRITDLTERPRRPRKKQQAPAAEGEEAAEEQVDPAQEQYQVARANVSAKVKQYLPFLKRQKYTPVIVEYVFSGNKVKAFVPKENVYIAFVLAGIRCPSTKPSKGEDEDDESALGIKARQYVIEKTLQLQNVKVEIETTDRGDNFIGTLFVNKRNLALDLLEQGLGKVFSLSADRSNYKNDLYKSEKKALDARLGVWENYVEPTPEEKTDEEKAEVTEGSQLEMRVTEIFDATTFYVHNLSDPQIEAVENKLKELTEAGIPESEEFKAEKGTICAGLFSDGAYYRVKVEDVDFDNDRATVLFIDYGNRDRLDMSVLRELPEDLVKVPFLAHKIKLAGVRPPTDRSGYAEDAALTLNDITWGKTLTGQVEMTDNDQGVVQHMTVYTIEEDESEEEKKKKLSVAQIMLREGWLRVQGRPARPLRKLAEKLEEDEEEGKRIQANIWEYGDVSDNEDDSDNEGRIDWSRP